MAEGALSGPAGRPAGVRMTGSEEMLIMNALLVGAHRHIGWQVVADITRPDALDETWAVCDAVVFTHGAPGDRHAMEAVDCGAVST